jgi:hypothetical protein
VRASALAKFLKEITNRRKVLTLKKPSFLQAVDDGSLGSLVSFLFILWQTDAGGLATENLLPTTRKEMTEDSRTVRFGRFKNYLPPQRPSSTSPKLSQTVRFGIPLPPPSKGRRMGHEVAEESKLEGDRFAVDDDPIFFFFIFFGKAKPWLQ